MAGINDLYDQANRDILATFAPFSNPTDGTTPLQTATYLPADPPIGLQLGFPIKIMPVDPIRSEGVSSNFIMFSAARADFEAVGYLPVQGDAIIDQNGVTYVVEQIQGNVSRWLDMLMLKQEGQP